MTTAPPTTPCPYSDTFTGLDYAVPDPKWMLAKSGKGNYPYIYQNKLRVSNATKKGESIAELTLTRSGNFDVRVKIWKSSGSINANVNWELRARIDFQNLMSVSMTQIGGLSRWYGGYKSGSAAMKWEYELVRVNTFGWLRLVRIGSTFYSYIKDGNSLVWQTVCPGFAIGAGEVTFNIRQDVTNNYACVGSFDDFTESYCFLTSAPTTAAPTTTAPTTEAPTSLAPTTVSPTSLAPTTVAPTTLASTTMAPTTVAPTTVAPTTIAPTTLSPTSLAPTTVAPTTLAPTTLEPSTLAPSTLSPTTLAPSTLSPTTEAPTTVAATTIAPSTLAPSTLAPTTLGPTTIAPSTLVPTTLASSSLPPTTEAPTSLAATTILPTTLAASTLAPSTIAPTTVVPTTLSPITFGPYTDYDSNFIANPGMNIRFIIQAGELAVSGDLVQVKLACYDSIWSVDRCFIGHQAAAGDLYDFDGSQRQVTFDGGSPSTTIGLGGKVSDTIYFSLDETKNLILSFYFSNFTPIPKKLGSIGYDTWYKLAGDEAQKTNVSSYTRSLDYYLRKFVESISVEVALTTPAPTTIVPTTAGVTTLLPTTSPPKVVQDVVVDWFGLAPTSLVPTTPLGTLAPTTPEPGTVAPTTIAPTTAPSTTVVPTTPYPYSCTHFVYSLITDEEIVQGLIEQDYNLYSLITDELTKNSIIC